MKMEQEVLDKPISAGAAEEWPEEQKVGALRTLFRHRELVQSLVFRDIRSRYKQSVLGVAWAILQPLAMAFVSTIVFSHIAKVDTGPIPYPIFAYIAILPWTFFSQGLMSGTECLTGNFNLITKIQFPREVFPIAAVLGRVVDLFLGAVVLVPLFILYHVHLTWTVLLVVPILIIQACLLVGLTFLFSSFNLFYRDVRHVMPLFTQVWMYLSPIYYPLSLVPKRYLGMYMLNPMTAVMEGYRRAALLGQMPMWDYLGIAGAVSLIVLIFGYRRFKRLEPLFAEMI